MRCEVIFDLREGKPHARQLRNDIEPKEIATTVYAVAINGVSSGNDESDALVVVQRVNRKAIGACRLLD